MAYTLMVWIFLSLLRKFGWLRDVLAVFILAFFAYVVYEIIRFQLYLRRLTRWDNRHA